MTFRSVRLPDGRVWLRVADPDWSDPMEGLWAQRLGGRWNPPASYRTVYLNADPETAHLQLVRMLEGAPVEVEDLDDGAYVLVAARLPRDQTVADAVSEKGLAALSLPPSYPADADGREVTPATCQPIGKSVKESGSRGVLCRSAATLDGRGTELAWFPATARSRARPLWDEPLPLGAWRDTRDWTGLGLPEQPRLRPRG